MEILERIRSRGFQGISDLGQAFFFPRSRFHRYSCNESTVFPPLTQRAPTIRFRAIHPVKRDLPPAVYTSSSRILPVENVSASVSFPSFRRSRCAHPRPTKHCWREKGGGVSSRTGRANFAVVAKGEKRASGTLCRPAAHCFHWP